MAKNDVFFSKKKAVIRRIKSYPKSTKILYRPPLRKLAHFVGSALA